MTHPAECGERTAVAFQSHPRRKVQRDRIARLQVTADPCPQILQRVLGLLAQHGTVPYGIAFARRPRTVRIEVEIDTFGPGTLDTLLYKVAALPTVRSSQLRGAGR